MFRVRVRVRGAIDPAPAPPAALVLRAAAGVPAPTLSVGDSDGALTYLTAALGGHGIAVALDDAGVDLLLAALIGRRHERDHDRRPAGGLCRTAQTPGLHTRPVGAGEAFTGMNPGLPGASQH